MGKERGELRLWKTHNIGLKELSSESDSRCQRNGLDKNGLCVDFCILVVVTVGAISFSLGDCLWEILVLPSDKQQLGENIEYT